MPIQVWIIGGLLAASLIGGAFYWTFSKGHGLGSAEVVKEVQSKTIETMDKARIEKGTTNEEIRRTPLDELIDKRL